MWTVYRCFLPDCCHAAEGETHQVQLPESLVEAIVARIPFPQILKARQLSKQWKSKFSKVVSDINWPEYYPAYFSKQRSRLEGYDRDQRRVKRMGRKRIKAPGLNGAMACRGALMAATDFLPGIPYPRPTTAIVINLLTRQSRKITCPLAPISANGDYVLYSAPILAPIGTDQYELVIWFSLVTNPTRMFQMTGVNVYNSASQTWKELRFEDQLGGSHSGAYVDNSLYFIPELLCRVRPMVFRFDTQTGDTKRVALPDLDDQVSGEWVHHSVVVCGSRVLAVRFEYNRRTKRFHVKILQLHANSFQFVELSKRPLFLRTRLLFEVIEHPVVASSSSVYILDGAPHMGENLICIKKYDVNSNTWDLLPFPTKCWGHRNLVVFEPGLNPFTVP